ncbi:PQ-loop-domain-containing protein, partial [Ramicandelaber brevisporus]
LSWLLGWAYFTAWSFSFYPQVIINYRRRSTKGLSLDFVVLNICGFFCYSVYTLAFYFSETVQEEYRERFGYNAPNLVQLNDVFFAVHALILSTVTLLQARWYNNSSSDSHYTVDQFVALAAGTSIVLLIAAYTGSSMWLDLIYFLSLVKFIVSFVKYIPQAYANYNAKSTVGWSIHNILLDSTGGILSIGQLLLDSYRAGGGDGGIAGNAIKLALGLLSISFDLIFITQHYVLY